MLFSCSWVEVDIFVEGLQGSKGEIPRRSGECVVRNCETPMWEDSVQIVRVVPLWGMGRRGAMDGSGQRWQQQQCGTDEMLSSFVLSTWRTD